MKEFNVKESDCESLTALYSLRQAGGWDGYPAYVGLDVHKETIAVSVARSGREAPESRGEISNRLKSVEKLVRRLAEEFGGEVLRFCYEAGPCGYGLYRQILKLSRL